jgi:hypothetical protein
MNSVPSSSKLLVICFDVEVADRNTKINNLISLVSKLPMCNYACLRVLLGHLLSVVKHSDKNKMTVRNISIVFSPTLGIPAGLFTLMLAEFSIIFSWKCHDASRMPSKEKKSIPSEQIEQAIQERKELAAQSSNSNKPTLLSEAVTRAEGEQKETPVVESGEASPQPVQLELPPEPETVLKPVRVMEQPFQSLIPETKSRDRHRYSEVPADMMKALADQLKDLGDDDLYEGEEADPQMLEEMVKELL